MSGRGCVVANRILIRSEDLANSGIQLINLMKFSHYALANEIWLTSLRKFTVHGF